MVFFINHIKIYFWIGKEEKGTEIRSNLPVLVLWKEMNGRASKDNWRLRDPMSRPLVEFSRADIGGRYCSTIFFSSML